MIRTLIVDDEAPAREELIYSLKKISGNRDCWEGFPWIGGHRIEQ